MKSKFSIGKTYKEREPLMEERNCLFMKEMKSLTSRAWGKIMDHISIIFIDLEACEVFFYL